MSPRRVWIGAEVSPPRGLDSRTFQPLARSRCLNLRLLDSIRVDYRYLTEGQQAFFEFKLFLTTS